MKTMTEGEAYAMYDDMLDECNPEIKIGYITLSPSRVLEECDPIAYHCGFSDWIDSAGIELE